MKKKKTELEIYYEDCWIYVLLLTTLIILLESLKTYTFKIFDINLTFSIFLLPVAYFLSSYILKKYDYKKAITSIAVSGIALVGYVAVMAFALREELFLTNISGEFCAYIISQFINITLYSFLMNNTKKPTILVFLTYMFSLIVYYMFYTLIYLNMIILDTYWKGYFTTLFIQVFICLFLTFIDSKIKRGRERIK